MDVVMNIRKITQMAERNSGYGWNCCVLSIPKTLIYRISGTIVKSLTFYIYLILWMMLGLKKMNKIHYI